MQPSRAAALPACTAAAAPATMAASLPDGADVDCQPWHQAMLCAGLPRRLVFILFLLACVQNVRQAPTTDIDGLEFFAGRRAITSAFRKHGWRMIPFDLSFDAAMNWNAAGGMACCPQCCAPTENPIGLPALLKDSCSGRLETATRARERWLAEGCAAASTPTAPGSTHICLLGTGVLQLGLD